MKSSIAALAVTIAAVNVMASPTTTGVAHRQNFVFSNKTTGASRDISQMCIDFSTLDSEDAGFYYTFQPPWGSSSGQAPVQGTICVPTSAKGGAMFIGNTPNPGPGSTKLECQFPSSGTANCDISLVDGYSVGVNCQVGNQYIGGESLVGDCPDQQGPNCINTQGYAPSQSDVAPFFQAGVQNGQNYCIWQYCSQDYYFPTGSQVSCAVNF